jgi:hypothetical protein
MLITKCITSVKQHIKKFGIGLSLNVSWMYNRCTKSGNRKNATGETGIRQKRNVTPESIGLVSIKAQADI